MANYFNTLPLRKQLEQLGKCRFMDASEFEDGVAALKDKKIVIVGCGAQGLNQGLNMRDSGLDISYALRACAHWAKSVKVADVDDAKKCSSMSTSSIAESICCGFLGNQEG